MLAVTDAAAGALGALLRHNPALPGRLARVVMDDAGALGVELTDAPGNGDVELRPGLLAGRRAAERVGGAVLDWDAAAGRLGVRRSDGPAATG